MLSELWLFIRDGVPGNVRAFWNDFEPVADAGALSPEQIEELIADSVRYTEAKFNQPIGQQWIDRMVRRGPASIENGAAEGTFIAALTQSYHW
ncbi:MAG: hypothetical protein WC729_25980 [Sphingomonas sp.]|uniref:hypothetical protein n=1 Tax=Sphingomonas sp. TaxID=28214 RepID=UPI0035619ECE